MASRNSVDAVLIAGPTASGKSGMAESLAREIGGVVINADSMQVYRELKILSARPSPSDVPHLLYGHVSAHELYSAGHYQEDVAKALAEAKAKGLVPIFTGGTGLYFSVLTEGLSPVPKIPAELRARVRARHQEIGPEAFYAELVVKDPASAALRATDNQRMMRAAEVLEATGKPLRQWQEQKGIPLLADMKLERFVIDIEREELYARIGERFERMMEEGALEEARALRNIDPLLPASKALGVPSLHAHLNGDISRQQAVEEAKRQTRNYAKRQMTWFRQRMCDWKWPKSDQIHNIITGKT